MERIYHPFWLWEDYKAGFYDNISGENKKKMIQFVLELFNSEELTRLNMNRVINEWHYSCEHNLTNDSMNKIAYLGQGACCIYKGVPNTITMEAWSLLEKDVQKRSDLIAKEIIDKWIDNQKNKQLCLKLD